MKNTDWWPNMVMLKALTQYQEATGDPRVVPFMQRYFAYHLAHAKERPLHEWAAVRWADELVSVLWLYNRTGDKSLLDLAHVLHDQGTDWKRHFADFEFREKTTPETLGMTPGAGLKDRAMRAHGVNNAMALKTSALWYLVSAIRAIARPFTARSRCSTVTTVFQTACSAPTSTTRAPIPRRAPSCAQWSRRSSRCSTPSA